MKKKFDIKFLKLGTADDFEKAKLKFNPKKYYFTVEDVTEVIRLIRPVRYEEKIDTILEFAISYIDEKLSDDFIDNVLAAKGQEILTNENVFSRTFFFIQNQFKYISEDESHLYNFIERMGLDSRVTYDGNLIDSSGRQTKWGRIFGNHLNPTEFFAPDIELRHKYRNFKFVFNDVEQFINHSHVLKVIGVFPKIDLEKSAPGIKLYLQLQ